MTALDLATVSKVGVATIRRVEVVDGEIPVTAANEAAIRGALESAGVDFIGENGTARSPISEASPSNPEVILQNEVDAIDVELIDENGGGVGAA